MNDVETLNDKLKNFEDPEDIKKFVLYCFKKDKNFVEKWRHNQRKKRYECKDNQKVFTIIMDTYMSWGLIEEYEKEEDGTTYRHRRITEKGLKALRWRYIAPLKPEWLTDNRKYIITTSIALAALLVSIIAIFRTL